ncbi:DUF4365 domain-containing protein [Rhodopirellula europaea]|uniref:DUF4365 domain-containing protein n=1 Tax=Rhodopirellula europaea TaxID=1263866 RepID=UPI003D270456|tara:strand:- start:60 stop:701 length:642 start_codon:yes stop_codon:yes gene_type:complete
MAKRRREHEIGDRAVKIALSRAPDHWVHQEQNRDYGVDLKFEVFRDERHSGFEFGVQVRGTEKVKKSKKGDFISCAIEVENLVDHVDKRRYPIYLFHVDVVNAKTYWTFLQEHARELSRKWRWQKEVTIRLPVSQNLDDLEDFESHFNQHLEFMKELHPGSVEAALRRARNEYSSLDNRFELNVASTGEYLRLNFTPKEPVKLALNPHYSPSL